MGSYSDIKQNPRDICGLGLPNIEVITQWRTMYAYRGTYGSIGAIAGIFALGHEAEASHKKMLMEGTYYHKQC